MSLEIERKYLCETIQLENILGIKIIKEAILEQNYLLVGEDELRIRKKKMGPDDSYFLTIKKGLGLIREESEIIIPPMFYNYLNTYNGHKPLVKKRTIFTFEGNEFSYDEYKDSKMRVIEIEFSCEEDATRFVPPTWIGTEVTDDKAYKNQNLWKEFNNF
ncbi:hypothetical protein HCA69_10060 [Listeria grandensis]|uniref:CYTH domain-containing protein n=1 Tax=Listeria grandensis TaxID=1494963 RepID=A0A7X0Y4A8_9LIST|nr:hypothetical protein [Listeria grandensis]MBC1936711.1 hypothetical protein [Listeria grandensis]